MAMSLATLLIHDDDVPAGARAALRDAAAAPASDRRALLEAAARALHHDADVDCADARELVGLAT
jgi:hypothetical protein